MQHVNDSKNRKRILLTCLIYDFQQKKKTTHGQHKAFPNWEIDFIWHHSGAFITNFEQIQQISSFHATGLFIPPENIRKLLLFWCLKGAQNKAIDMEWFKPIFYSISWNRRFPNGTG